MISGTAQAACGFKIARARITQSSTTDALPAIALQSIFNANPKLTYTLTLSILSMFCTHTCSKKRFENEESLLFYCLCSMSLQSNLYI